MATGLLTTSCDTDNVAELYNAQQENVAMQTSTIALKQSEADGEYSVQVVRSKTQGEYTVAYSFKGDDVFVDEGHGSKANEPLKLKPLVMKSSFWSRVTLVSFAPLPCRCHADGHFVLDC